MYKIGELSKLSKLPVKTLRFYDSKGILPADYIDDFTGYRYYSAVKLSDCYRIIALKELGFTLSEIKEIFAESEDYFLKVVSEKEQELYELKKQTEYRINILRSLKEKGAMFNIVVRKSEQIRLAYMRKTVKSQAKIGGILKEMQNKLPSEISGERAVIIDYETEFTKENFDAGFGVEITDKIPKDCDFEEKILSFDCDTANLICTDSEYEEALKALNKYVLENNYQIVGPSYKIIYGDGTIELKLPVIKLCKFNPDYNENINLPFVNDSEVIGRWEMFDCLPCKEMFDHKKPKTSFVKDAVKELYFLPDGEKYWCFSWTAGLLLSDCGYPHRKSQNKYTVEKIGNETFMFVEFKAYNYFEGGKPEIWVLKKADGRKYTKKDIRQRDEIPQNPADDGAVLGKWKVCDLVRNTADFNPVNTGFLIPYEGLYWRSAEFFEDGKMLNRFKNSESDNVFTDKADVWRWVNGYVICTPQSTASKYEIHRYGNTEYLFIQWKSGDYVYGGEEPFWYVFKR